MLGKYEIRERLGRGGMAEVFRAYHANLDRFVAIKVLHGFLADDPEFKSRFEKEARNIARLKHPHIVQVYDFDFDSDSDSYYMVMELIEGPTLKERLSRLLSEGRLLSVLDAVRIVGEATGALAYAHSQNMVHRDVKPGNLMLDRDNRIVLADFGIAKIVTGAQFTSTGGMVGTPAYMSPEQGLGEPGDERSDLYSLGVIFYQLLTGRLPYDAEAPLAVILKHLNEPIPSVRSIRPTVPEQVDTLIMRLMAKDPATRYQTANDLIADLDMLEQSLAAQEVEEQELVSNLVVPVERASTRTPISEYLAQRTPVPAPLPSMTGAAVLPAPPVAGTVLQHGADLWRWVALALFVVALLIGAVALAGGGIRLPFAAAAPTETATTTPSPTTEAQAALVTAEPSATGADAEPVTHTPVPVLPPSRAPAIERLPTRAPSPTATQLPAASATFIATDTPTATDTATVTASPTRTAQPTRTSTPTISPTPTVQPLLEVTQTLVQATRVVEIRQATLAACTFDYAIVDQTPADGEYFPTGSSYTREIVLRNTGNCAWERNSSLNYVSGESFSAGPRIFIRERVEPGAEYVLRFEGQTPTQGGSRTGMWELRTPEFMQIGEPFEISIYAYSQGRR